MCMQDVQVNRRSLKRCWELMGNPHAWCQRVVLGKGASIDLPSSLVSATGLFKCFLRSIMIAESICRLFLDGPWVYDQARLASSLLCKRILSMMQRAPKPKQRIFNAYIDALTFGT